MFSRPLSSVISTKQGAVSAAATDHFFRRIIVIVLIIASLLTSAYTALSFYVATQLVYQLPKPVGSTPASLSLQFRYVSFPSREDHIQLRGWFIPGVLPNGSLTAQRTIIMVHGTRTNRADKVTGLLDLSGAFARNGLAVLAFDMRGAGESPPAPLSLGYFEQRDVLGAVDFLRSGPIPYPE
ncbi:MAG: hypothetical protein JO202_10085, partial [Ktedonobacteraceae bacterium]|nr:hypothetical protein [Ktedonobacteraceae bacterium]